MMSTDFSIKLLTKDNDAEHELFLNELSEYSPSVLAYHYPFYKNILESCSIADPFYAGLYLKEELVAILPGFIKTTDIGTVYSSMPFFGPNAGVMCKQPSFAEQAHLLLLNFIETEVKKMHNPVSLSFYTPFLDDTKAYYETILKPDEIIKKETQYIFMPPAEWDGKIKYDLRKAERSGITISEVVTAAKVDELYKIYLQNCIDYNIPIKPKSVIDALSKNATEGNNTAFYFTHHEGKIIGGLIVLFSKKTISYYLPCSLDSARTLQPVTYMINYAFQKAKAKNIEYWNWEASPNKESGVYKFKNKWGSLDATYYILIKLFTDINTIKIHGQYTISKAFPYFYVYPFNKL